MNAIWKRGLMVAAAGALGGAMYLALRPSPSEVEAGVVARGPMQTTIDAEGKTRVRDRYVVAAPIAGRLIRIGLRRGDAIAAGAPVARIEPLPMQPLDPRQTAEARARVAAAQHLKTEADAVAAHTRADCEQAQRERDRAAQLVETGDVSRQEFERARIAEQTCRQQLDAAQARARAAAADIDVARAALLALEQAGPREAGADLVVRAPVGGRVLRVLEESERVVPAGTPLLEISNPVLEIVADVLSTDAVRVTPGLRVLVEGWGGDRALPAAVRLIEPSAFTKVSALGIEEQRVNVVADFTGPADAHGSLGDGYRVELRIVVWERPDALKVPAGALFRHEGVWSVFRIEAGRARLRTVEIDHRTDREAEVIRHLNEGDRVVLHPPNSLADGMRITNSR